jgi:hypothetical protein
MENKMINEELNIKSFLGLTSTSAVEKLIYQVERKTKIKITDKLQSWHKKYEDEQSKLEEFFNYDDLDSIRVNFCDDFHDDGYVPEGEVTESFAVIDEERLPDIECHKQLNSLREYILDKNLLPKSVKLRMYLADSTAEYPSLIDEHEYMLTKTWKIKITNITHEQLDTLMDKLKDYSNNIPYNIYSES